jgi:hypothetical protein
MLVTIGQNEMNFEAGPWHAFGTEILDKIVAILEAKPSVTSGSGLPPELEKKITFVPDYSVTIQDDCTYLEVTSTTYLLAYKTTLITRGSKVQPDDPQPSHYASSDNVGQTYCINERIKEEDSPSNGTIIRVGKDKINGHKRSSSDSQSHLIPKSPPKDQAEDHHQKYDFNSDVEAAALLPKS